MRWAWAAVCVVSAAAIGAAAVNYRLTESLRRKTTNVAVTQLDQGNRLDVVVTTTTEINKRLAALEANSNLAAEDFNAPATDSRQLERLASIEAAIADLASRAPVSAVGQERTRRIAVDLSGESRDVAIERADKQSFTPVSMTPIGDGLFLLANYRNIYVFDEKKSKAYPIKLDRPVPIWNPTAVHYSPYFDRVFIANYTGQDILIASLDRSGERIALHLDERLTHPEGIQGAEGIDVSVGGRYMAVANWEGANLAIFERVDDQWVYRWKRHIQSSHGVAIIGEQVFGSGTTIAKFDIATGTELARVSSIAGAPVLFTTCLDHDEQTGDLIASDTMAGRVFTMTRDLVAKEVFGANGPGLTNLSMPYCVYRNADETYILSTYQDRAIRIKDGVTTSFAFAPAPWDYLADAPQQTYDPNIWAGVNRRDSPSFRLFDRVVRPSYGSLVGEDNAHLTLPNRTGLASSGWLFYVSSIAKDGPWLAVAANSSPVAILINTETRQLASVELPEQDCWASARVLLCPSGTFEIPALLKSAAILTPGSIEDIARQAGKTLDQILSEFTSEGGLKLKASPTRASASEYLTWAKGKSVPLIEYWLAVGLAHHTSPVTER